MAEQKSDIRNEFDYLLVVDLEATCSEDKKIISREEMEIIEVGAALVDLSNLSIVWTFESLAKPARHPFLTEFCTKLTTITQDMVENAPPLMVAMSKLYEKSREVPVDKCIAWASWGDFDRNQIRKDCAYFRIPYRMPHKHFNLKNMYSKSQSRKRGLGLGKALRSCGKSFQGTPHRALSDVLAICEILPWALGDKQLETHPRKKRVKNG